MYRFLLLLLFFPLFSFAQETIIHVVNKGVRGENTVDLLARIDKDVFRENPDVVILMIGTNDLMSTGKMLSIKEYTDNVASIINQLSVKDIKVLVVSPPTLDPVYIYTRHDSTQYNIPLPVRMRLGRDAIKEVCREREIPFADLYNFFECLYIPKHNQDDIIMNEKNSNTKDGIHMTKKGNELLAYFIFTHLKAAIPFTKGMKILCFGDSITHGVFMKGAGTSNGNTYPAILKRLIINDMNPN
jgi:lysophospholipase L1-like esterase